MVSDELGILLALAVVLPLRPGAITMLSTIEQFER